MTPWTETARTELEHYFTRIRPALNASGADASEVIEDLRRHLDAEVAAAKLSVVTEQDVQRLLARIGAPESPPVPSQTPNPSPPISPAQPSAFGPGRWASALLLFAGVILPVITLALEIVTRMCTAAFFDPLPTPWNALLVAFVPVANLLAWHGVREGRVAWRSWLGWLNSAAIGVALYYAFLFLPLLVPGVVAIVFFGWGLLPWSPMLSLIAAVGLRRYLRRLGCDADVPLPGFWRGLGLGLLALALIESPNIITKIGLQKAAADTLEEQRAGIRWLRWLGREDTMLRACYGYTRRAREMDILGALSAGDDHLSAEKAREIFYRVTGQPFNSVPPPTVRTARGVFAELNEWTWDEDHGGDRVGGRIKGLSLHSSRLDTVVDAEAAWSYTEWTLEFKNDSVQNREARAQILLPPGGVVSRLTLWVNGEEREAAFAGRSQVREAYRKVAVEQRRDPVLVTTAGPDRVLMQCFPVPRHGGLMKVRVGITAPLAMASLEGGRVRLPYLLERNFNLAEGFRHSVWAGGDTEIRANGNSLSAEASQPGHSALRGTLANSELASPKALLTVVRDPARLTTWCKDDRDSPARFIRQTLETTPAQRPGRVVFVVDGSRDMSPFLTDLADAIASVATNTETTVFVASDEVVTFNGTEASARLRQFSAKGGQDNAAALLEAWNLAAQNPGSAIVWIHAPQPVLFASAEALTQALERAGTGAPHLFEFQTIPGADRVLEKLDGFTHVHSVLRTDGLAHDLKQLLQSWQTARPEVLFNRVACDTESAARESAARETSLHLARLWAQDEIRRLRKERKTEDAVRLAGSHQLVTPISGAVVLENQQQYRETGLQPVASETVPAIPEPGTGALFGLGAVLWGLRRRSLRRAGGRPVLRV